MGCDIHGWVERKVGDKWVALSELREPGDARNYNRFAMLAGVRGEGGEALGLPDDISDTAGYWARQWDIDGHSFSYMGLSEATEIFSKTERAVTIYEKDVEYWFGFVAGIPINELRLIFWFDN